MVYQNSVDVTQLICIKFLVEVVSSYAPATKLKVPAPPDTVQDIPAPKPDPVITIILV